MPPQKKRGRPPKYVSGRDGKPVVGLSYNRSNKQYYAAHAEPRKYFGPDFDMALAKFRAWESGNSGECFIPLENLGGKSPIMVDLPISQTWQGPVFVAERIRTGKPVFQEVPESMLPTLKRVKHPGRHALVNDDVFYAKCRELIHDDPVRFAERVGIPEIGYLQHLTPPAPSMSLRQVGDLYFQKRKKVSQEWERKQRAFWREFVKSVGVRTVREINAELIDEYHNSVWDSYEESSLSATYIQHRFQAVRTIFRYALKRRQDSEQVRRVLDLTESFELPRRSAPNPRPIGRAEFEELLRVSSVKWRAVFLLSLNCAFYPSEVSAVESTHLDFDAKTLIMDRGKTGVPRIAVLWDRTIAAIEAYLLAEPHDASNLFISASGSPYNANHMGRNFRRRRAEAKLGDDVTFDSVRDGAYTAAVNGGASVDQARMLSGQRVSGVTDYYLKRNPSMVADACAAIEQAYFGKRR